MSPSEGSWVLWLGQSPLYMTGGVFPIERQRGKLPDLSWDSPGCGSTGLPSGLICAVLPWTRAAAVSHSFQRETAASQPLTSCPLVGFHCCKGAQLATSIHLFKTDTSIDSISSINPEVFCKHKVGLCSNLTKQLRRQSDVSNESVHQSVRSGENYLSHRPYLAKN